VESEATNLSQNFFRHFGEYGIRSL
jgi:hypothetical protein